MEQDLPLGPHTSQFRQATFEFLQRFAPDSSCHLAFMGWYDRFKAAEHASAIGKVAHRKPSEVIETWDRIFKPCFGNLEYEEWRLLCARQQFMRDLPTDPTLRFFAREALLAGHRFDTLNRRHRSGARYVCTRLILLDGELCRIHRFERRTSSYIACHAFEDVSSIGIVVASPEPTHGVVIPSNVLSAIRRARNGTHVRVNLCNNYPGSIHLGAAA